VPVLIDPGAGFLVQGLVLSRHSRAYPWNWATSTYILMVASFLEKIKD
jgi:hypothetical protein